MKTKYRIDAEIVVVGGGPAGVAAAVTAGRSGAKTLMIEQYGFAGGLATTGLPLLSFHTLSGKQVFRGVAQEIVDRLVGVGGSPGHVLAPPDGHAGSMTPVYPEATKWVSDQMLREAGAELLLHAKVVDGNTKSGHLRSIIVAAKEGLIEVTGKVFIDATGDADLVYHAGGNFDVGRSSDGRSQTATALFTLGGVAVTEVARHFAKEHYYAARPDEGAEAKLIHLSGGLGRFRDSAKAEYPFSDDDHALWAMCLRPGQLSLNLTDLAGFDTLTSRGLTEAELSGREQIWRVVRFLKENVPGFSESYLLSSPPCVGVRETRRIRGLRRITASEVLEGAVFDDVVVRSGYCIDLHDPDGKGIIFEFQRDPDLTFDIPYSSLVPEDLDNVVVAGRSLSATHEALAATRLMALCMQMGEATAYAAAVALPNGNTHKVPVGEIQNRLRESGGLLW